MRNALGIHTAFDKASDTVAQAVLSGQDCHSGR